MDGDELWCPSRIIGPARLVVMPPRMFAVVERVVQGWTNDEIKRDLFVTLDTVKTQLRSAYARVGVNDRATLTAMLHRRDIVIRVDSRQAWVRRAHLKAGRGAMSR